MIDLDFIIFEYLSTREILRIFEFYFGYDVQNTTKLKNKKVLNLKLGNEVLIGEIEDKYPVKVKCEYKINPDKINWMLLSINPNTIHLLEQNPDKIN